MASIADFSEQEWLDAIQEIAQVNSERQGLTTEEFCQKFQVGAVKAHRILRQLKQQGKLTVRYFPDTSLRGQRILRPEYCLREHTPL